MAENESSDILTKEAIFLILLVLFLASSMYYLNYSSNSAYLWQDFYAKQIASFLNAGYSGQDVSFSVGPAMKVAKRSGLDISNPENLFVFDASNNLVCVRLSKGAETCYPYFNEVAVTNVKFELGDEAVMAFTIEEKGGAINE